MWKKIRNLFRRILRIFLVSEDKTAVNPEIERKFIIDQSHDLAQPGVSTEESRNKSGQRKVLEDEPLALLEDQIESQEKFITIDLEDNDNPEESVISKNGRQLLSKEGIKADNIEPSRNEEIFGVESLQLEEDNTLIENHIIDEPVNMLETLYSEGDLTNYIQQFSNLINSWGPIWTAKTKGQAPHKPLLLLSILDLFARGQITKNLIEISPDLIELFTSYWNIVIPERRGQIALPFFHLKSSNFWHLIALPGQEAVLKDSRRIRSLSFLQKIVLGAKLDEKLFELLQIKEKRDELLAVLIHTYFDSDLHPMLHEQGQLTKEADSYSQQLLETTRDDIVIEESRRKTDDGHLENVDDQIESQIKMEIVEPDNSISIKELINGEIEEPALIEENQELINIEVPRVEEIFDSSQAEEEIALVTNQFIDVPADDVDYWESDNFEADDFIESPIDKVDQSLEKERFIDTGHPQDTKFEEKKGDREIYRRKVEYKRKLFYYEFHPIPVLDNLFVEKLIRLAEEGMLKTEFGYDSQRVEVFLLNIFKHYNFIGEIPFGRKSFEYLCELIQKCYIKSKSVNITQVPPALFVTSMVFCARYSEEEARNFWEPYAKIVWRKESSQYFQNISRRHFVDCKEFLQKYDFVFPIINQGDVVRPVYYQAVIPYYLQSNFAEWLVERFEKILEFSTDTLPLVLREEKSLDYVPPRLRNFVQQSETSETAAKLIQQMAKAIKLFQTTEQFEAVNSVMSSPIERSLWREIYQELIEKQLRLETIRKYTPKLEWIWDLEHNDLYLKLSQVRSAKDEKPNLIVWAEKESKDLRNEEILLDINPWQLSNGDWELEPETITDKGDPSGKIYVLSEEYDFEKGLESQNDHVIVEKDLPEINQDIVFFFFSANRSVARMKEKININGDWVVLSKDQVEIIDHKKSIQAYEDLYIPALLRDNGYQFAKKYSITLPIILQTQNKEVEFIDPQSTFVVQAELLGKKQIKGLSKNIQPIFQTQNVILELDAEFTETEFARTWVSIHKGGMFLTSVSLTELQKRKQIFKRDRYFITLKDFINEPGSYSVNILYDLQMLLEENIRFAYLPNVTISGPDPNICYSPANPLKITLNGVEKSRVKTGIEEKVKFEYNDEGIQLLWKELKLPEVRFSIQWEGNNINFSWDINRVTAWIDGGGDKNNIIAGQEDNVVLNARGNSKEEIVWFIRDTNHRRKINLDSQGVYLKGLNQSALRDLLKNSDLIKSHVAIKIRDYTWDVFTYNKIPSLNITFVGYDKPHLTILINQSERLRGDFSIQIRDTDKPINPLTISKVDFLEEKSRFRVDLIPGIYQIEILLGDEILAVSQEIIVSEKIIDVVPAPKRNILITKGEEFTAQNLYGALSSSRKEIQEIQENKQSNLISILQQLVKINCRDTWVTREKWDEGLKMLLPSWAVLKYPLRFQTQLHRKIFHIFPQQVVFGAKAGKGYMAAKLGIDPVKIYAAWNTDFDNNKTFLWLKFPQVESIERFCELDEYDLWPGYQCIDCGIIVGSRRGTYLQLSPQTVKLHMHNKSRSIKDQFINVDDKPIEGQVSQYQEIILSHCYRPNEVIGENYFNELDSGKIRPLQGTINIPLDVFKPTDYYIAISEAFQNYQNLNFHVSIKQIIGKEQLFNDIKGLLFERKDEVPAFSATLRLEQQISSGKRLYFLPKYVLLLSTLLRLKAYNPQLYEEFLAKHNAVENEIVSLTFQAMKSCPKLLEWSIAWTEIFFNHASS
jgi:predicted restriction endonuclease